jgi:hypothetical protein
MSFLLFWPENLLNRDRKCIVFSELPLEMNKFGIGTVMQRKQHSSLTEVTVINGNEVTSTMFVHMQQYQKPRQFFHASLTVPK